MGRGNYEGEGAAHCKTQQLQIQLPTERGTTASHFSAHVYCGQTAGWIRILLGTEVGLNSNDIVLDGDRPAPPPWKEAKQPRGLRTQTGLSNC